MTYYLEIVCNGAVVRLLDWLIVASDVGLVLGGGFVVRFVTIVVEEEAIDVECVDEDIGLVVDWVVVVEVDIVSLCMGINFVIFSE